MRGLQNNGHGHNRSHKWEKDGLCSSTTKVWQTVESPQEMSEKFAHRKVFPDNPFGLSIVRTNLVPLLTVTEQEQLESTTNKNAPTDISEKHAPTATSIMPSPEKPRKATTGCVQHPCPNRALGCDWNSPDVKHITTTEELNSKQGSNQFTWKTQRNKWKAATAARRHPTALITAPPFPQATQNGTLKRPPGAAPQEHHRNWPNKNQQASRPEQTCHRSGRKNDLPQQPPRPGNYQGDAKEDHNAPNLHQATSTQGDLNANKPKHRRPKNRASSPLVTSNL